MQILYEQGNRADWKIDHISYGLKKPERGLECRSKTTHKQSNSLSMLSRIILV